MSRGTWFVPVIEASTFWLTGDTHRQSILLFYLSPSSHHLITPAPIAKIDRRHSLAQHRDLDKDEGDGEAGKGREGGEDVLVFRVLPTSDRTGEAGTLIGSGQNKY